MSLSPSATVRRVLVVDDEPAVARAFRKILERLDFEVLLATDLQSASHRVMNGGVSVVVCDIGLPGGSGVEVLRMVKAYDVDIPVILVTGNPTIQTAIEAVELGAHQYLEKPVTMDALQKSVERAFTLGQLARLKRDALHICAQPGSSPSDMSSLSRSFERALSGMRMVFQPIIDLRRRSIAGYEALLRSREPDMSSPADVLSAAERLGRQAELGQRVRALVSEAIPIAPRDDMLMFINLHTAELLDPFLYSQDAPLSCFAKRIVLEITERASLDSVGDAKDRVRSLRGMGYRLALDDLGAGYAGLNSFSVLEPEIVKLDMSLVRNVHRDPMKYRLIESMMDLCRSLTIEVVAEGIETPEELDAIRTLGCDYGQGYCLARPSPDFEIPSLTWGR